MSTRLKHIEYGYEVEAKGATPSLFKQVHGSNLVELDSVPNDPEEADGAYTSRQHFTLSVFTADCIPLLFFTEDAYDPVAAVHCGWRGAEKNIAQKTIETVFPKVTTLHAVIGPSILKCCFEVKKDLILSFKQAGYSLEKYLEIRSGKIFFDLLKFVKETQLARVPHLHEEQVRCTACSSPTLPSYRRNKETDPRLRSWIRKF